MVPIPWTPVNFGGRKLRLAYFIDNGFVEPVAGVTNGIQKAIEAIKRAGHAVIPFSPMININAIYQMSVRFKKGPCTHLYFDKLTKGDIDGNLLWIL